MAQTKWHLVYFIDKTNKTDFHLVSFISGPNLGISWSSLSFIYISVWKSNQNGNGNQNEQKSYWHLNVIQVFNKIVFFY